MNQGIVNLDIRELLYILRKHIRLLIIFTAICGVSGFCVSSWAVTPRYESAGIMIVNNAALSNMSITYDQISAAQKLVNTYAIILKSDKVLDQVIENLGLSIASTELVNSIKIEGINSTEVIEITVRYTEPQVAADIANEIMKIAPSVISRTMSAGSVGIISPAKGADAPIFPNIALLTTISGVGGLGVSMLLSLLLEIFNNTFTSGADVQKYLAYPVISVMPAIKKKTMLKHLKHW